MASIIRLQLLVKAQHPELYLYIETQTCKTDKTVQSGHLYHVGNSVATCVLLLVC